MAWIEMISYEASKGRLRKLYDRVKSATAGVDNILMSHSLRPGTLSGHMALYKNVLHHSESTLPKWFREAIGTYVSMLNRCNYCVEHHYVGMKRLLGDDTRSAQIREALEADSPDRAFEPKDAALFAYARKLTVDHGNMAEADVVDLRDAGWDDGVIVEVNQVAAYFAYANRTVLGLGVSTDGDVLGLSPNDSNDPDNWEHS